MSASPDTQLLQSISTPPTLRASVEQVAVSLGESVGAWACYLALAPSPGQTPRLLAMHSRTGDLPTWRSIEGASLLRRIAQQREPLQVQAGGWPALVLPITNDDQAIGAALLLYAQASTIDIQRATAAAHERIGSRDKRLIWFDHSGHQLPREREREQVNAAALEWLGQRS